MQRSLGGEETQGDKPSVPKKNSDFYLLPCSLWDAEYWLDLSWTWWFKAEGEKLHMNFLETCLGAEKGLPSFVSEMSSPRCFLSQLEQKVWSHIVLTARNAQLRWSVGQTMFLMCEFILHGDKTEEKTCEIHLSSSPSAVTAG